MNIINPYDNEKLFTLTFKFNIKTPDQARQLAQEMFALYNDRVNLWCGTYGKTYVSLPDEFLANPELFYDKQ